MKLQVNNNTYVASNNEVYISEDMSRVSACSYDWWKYIATDSVGNIIFNHVRYSISTSRHQNQAHTILSRLGIRKNLRLSYTKNNLTDIRGTIEDEIRCIKLRQSELLYAATNKGSRKATNSCRANEFKKLHYRVKDLERFLDNYLDKKKAPVGKYNISLERLGSVFMKSNGKIDTDLISKIDTRAYCSGLNNDSNKTLKTLLGVSKIDAACYVFSNDLATMLEDHILDPAVAKRVKSLIKNGVNSFTLDKIHTYLVNKLNKVAYTPADKEAVDYKINPALLGKKDLTPIINRYKLRQEGKVQHHCIGRSKNYHDGIVTKSNQAFNFMGYTFYTKYDLTIIAAHGKYNSKVPSKAIEKFKSIINAA